MVAMTTQEKNAKLRFIKAVREGRYGTVVEEGKVGRNPYFILSIPERENQVCVHCTPEGVYRVDGKERMKLVIGQSETKTVSDAVASNEKVVRGSYSYKPFPIAKIAELEQSFIKKALDNEFVVRHELTTEADLHYVMSYRILSCFADIAIPEVKSRLTKTIQESLRELIPETIFNFDRSLYGNLFVIQVPKQQIVWD